MDFLKVKFHVSFYIINNRDIWTGDKFKYSSTNISLTNAYLKGIYSRKVFFAIFLAEQFDADKTN